MKRARLTWDCIDAAEGTQDAQRAERAQLRDARDALDEADDDDDEVDPVPAVAQVGLAVYDEAHRDDLDDALEGEYDREEDAGLFDHLVVRRDVIAVPVIVHCEEERVQEDEQDDHAVKPPKHSRICALTSTRRATRRSAALCSSA